MIYNVPHTRITILLKMTSNSPTCLISKKLKQQENVFQISYNTFHIRLPYTVFQAMQILCTKPSCILTKHCASQACYRQHIKLDIVTEISDHATYRICESLTDCMEQSPS